MASRYEEIMKTKPYLPLRMGYLTDAMIAKAERELGETEAVKAKTIPELRKLVQAEPDLVCPTDDAYMLQYLRPRKFNVKKAFSLIQNYHKVKKAYGEVYDTLEAEKAKLMLNLKAVLILPYRDEDGCIIYIIKISNWDPDIITVPEGIATLTLALLWALEDPATQVCGVRLLLDVSEVYLKQIRQLTPRYLQLFSKALRNCIPARFKGIHIFNESAIFPLLWSVLKLFLSEKIKRRVHFHSDNLKQLHKVIPKAILPVEEYGGDNPNDVSSWFIGEVEQYFEKYRELTTYGYRD